VTRDRFVSPFTSLEELQSETFKAAHRFANGRRVASGKSPAEGSARFLPSAILGVNVQIKRETVVAVCQFACANSQALVLRR